MIGRALDAVLVVELPAGGQHLSQVRLHLATVDGMHEHARQAWDADQRFTWYELPMIGGLGRLAKPFITGGMKKGTPAQYHGNAVTVFGGVGPWKERLGVRDDTLAYLVLLDPGGIVRWVHAGAFDAGKAAELGAQIRGLLDAAPRPQTQ